MLKSFIMQVVLASASPRRKEILAYLDIPFIAHSAGVDETPRAGEPPHDMVLRLSRAKADRVMRANGYTDEIVLAADTTVVLDGAIIGKPKDEQDAIAILQKLRGRTHQVFTGLSLHAPSLDPSPVLRERSGSWSSLCESRVVMRDYTDAEIERYIATGSPFDKAGAYAIQDADFHPVEKIVGCYLNVMGLPLCEVIRGLRTFGMAIQADEPVLHNCLGPNGQPCWA